MSRGILAVKTDDSTQNVQTIEIKAIEGVQWMRFRGLGPVMKPGDSV
jgi:hypothetical protein